MHLNYCKKEPDAEEEEESKKEKESEEEPDEELEKEEEPGCAWLFLLFKEIND